MRPCTNRRVMNIDRNSRRLDDPLNAMAESAGSTGLLASSIFILV
jgi:hypothetical protein